MCISNAVRNISCFYILQAIRLNKYVTYLLLLSIALLGDSNSSTEMGGKCLFNVLVSDPSLLCCCAA